jgi:hypothetical protein
MNGSAAGLKCNLSAGRCWCFWFLAPGRCSVWLSTCHNKLGGLAGDRETLVIQVLPEPLSWWTGCFCGVTLTNVYGTGREARSSGDDIFEPLRAELDRRGTLAFLHGEQTPGRYRAPSRFLPTPVAEVPNETYKAATDLVTSGRKRQYPNVRIILSHSGGSTRYCQDCGWVVSGDLRFG